jgi:hypothetical protein
VLAPQQLNENAAGRPARLLETRVKGSRPFRQPCIRARRAASPRSHQGNRACVRPTHGGSTCFTQGANGGLHRAGGENETFWQKLGDYVDDWTAQKTVVQPGSKEAGVLNQSINEIPYTPTREGLQATLNSGRVYTYEQRFGGAELYSREGNIFVPTRSLGLPTNYLGSQLAHEYFHVLSYQFTGLSGSEMFANRFGEASSYIGPSRAQILANYPTAPDLYRAVLRGPLNY